MEEEEEKQEEEGGRKEEGGEKSLIKDLKRQGPGVSVRGWK